MLSIKDHRPLYYLLAFSLLIRLFAAAVINLGNDEVYYWTYALYPDWSHFDHPPMVGYFIQLFSLNLLFDHEVFLRLSSVICGTINTYVFYLIGMKIGNKLTAFYSALLYTSSIYCTVIVGVFIMPDTPMMFMWTLSLYLIIDIIGKSEIHKAEHLKLLLFGLTSGLAILSKYHAVFLWFGFVAFVILYRRAWLRTFTFYCSGIISLSCTLPILIWNRQNDFISFKFQGERVSFFEHGLRPDYFATEFFGQWFYNNPFNYILIVIAVWFIFRKLKAYQNSWQQLLLLISLPLILTVLFFSLFRKTLPHWSGPAFTTLIPLAAFVVQEKGNKMYLKLVSWGMGLAFIFIFIGMIEINFGLFTNSLMRQSKDYHKKGKYDVTQDMYGWEQLSEKMIPIFARDKADKVMNENSTIISKNWYTAAHLDYYLAYPNDMKLYAFGTLKDIHKYAWIDLYRGEIALNSNAYFIAHGRAYTNPEFLKPYFEGVIPRDTIPVMRSGDTVSFFFVFHLLDYKGNFKNPLYEIQKERR